MTEPFRMARSLQKLVRQVRLAFPDAEIETVYEGDGLGIIHTVKIDGEAGEWIRTAILDQGRIERIRHSKGITTITVKPQFDSDDHRWVLKDVPAKKEAAK
jgi:hypothetical protein